MCSFSKTREFNPKHSAVTVETFDDVQVSIPVMCMQCEDAYCVKICPVGAASKNEVGAVVINQKKCIGCKMCLSVCPLGNISYNAEEKKIIKCNLCDGDPKCAQLCPSGAIQYNEDTEANSDKKRIVARRYKEFFGEGEK